MGEQTRRHRQEEKAREYRNQSALASYYQQKLAAWFFGGLVLLLLAVAVAIPVALGLALWMALKDRLAKRDWAIVLAAGAIATAAQQTAAFTSYGTWMWSLISGDGNRLAIPFLPLLGFAATTAGVAGIISGAKWLGVVPFVGRNSSNKFTEPESVIPTDEEREQLNIVGIPSQGAFIDPTQHGIATTGAVEHGKRTFPLGLDRTGTPFQLSEKEVSVHSVILGSTGSGKTETIKNIIANLGDMGWDICLLDLKEDLEPESGLRAFCRTYAKRTGYPYQEVALSDPDSPQWFNPLFGLGADEARDCIMSLQEFEAPYYKAINERQLGALVNAFYYANQVDPTTFEYPDIYRIGTTLTQRLPQATKKMCAVVKANIPGITDDDLAPLQAPSQDEVNAAPGLGARLTAMYQTLAGRQTLRPQGDDHRPLDVTQPGIAYIGLDSLGKPELSKIVSSAVLLRLAAYAAQRTRQGGKPKPRALIIDEANFVDRKILLNLLSRARSAGLAVFVATQGPLDWETGRNDIPGWGALTQNVNVGVFMRQANPESAELCAEYLGKEERDELSSRVEDNELVDGYGTVRKRLTYRVDPEELRELKVGEAVVKVGVPDARLSWVRVNMRDPNTGIVHPRPDTQTDPQAG